MADEGTPHWDDKPEAWDTLKLTLKGETFVMPGPWDIEDGNVKRVLDIKKAPGRDGATIKDMGYENGALVCRGQLLTNDHWQRMQVIAAKLKLTQKGKQREPLLIEHPKALYLGITRVYVTEIESPTLDNGIMTCSIRVLEYVDKPKGAGKSTKKANETLEQTLARAFSGEFKGNNTVTASKTLKGLEAKRVKELERANKDFAADQASGKAPSFAGKGPSYGAVRSPIQ